MQGMVSNKFGSDSNDIVDYLRMESYTSVYGERKRLQEEITTHIYPFPCMWLTGMFACLKQDVSSVYNLNVSYL